MTYPTTPLLDILPQVGYRDNEAVSWVTKPVDTNYNEVASTLESYHTMFDLPTASDEVLDFLAALVGLTGSYWNKTWSLRVKRNMVNNAHLFWRYLGTEACINAVISAMSITATLWLRKRLTLPFTMPGKLEQRSLRFIILMPFPTSRTSYEWVEAENILKLYAPVVTDSKVCYSKFKLGYSKIGDVIL